MNTYNIKYNYIYYIISKLHTTPIYVSVFKNAGLEKWRKKVVLLCTDGASVNTGKKNGVAAKLKTSLDYIIAVHCIAHRLEIGVSKSLQDHHRLTHLNDVLVFLYEQYHYSPKALCELRMLGEALEEKVLKPTTMKGSRRGPLHLQGFKGTHCFTCLQVNLHPCGIEPEPFV